MSRVSRTSAAAIGRYGRNSTQIGRILGRPVRRHSGELLGGRVEELPESAEAETAEEPSAGERSARRTEAQRLQNVRLGQAFFRATILASYQGQCCICRLPCKMLLVSSHIIPWAARPEFRLDPRNGLCLCAMHDKAFDRGLLAVDSSFR